MAERVCEPDYLQLDRARIGICGGGLLLATAVGVAGGFPAQ